MLLTADDVPLFLNNEECELWEMVTVARGYAHPTVNALRELARSRAALLAAEFGNEGHCCQSGCDASKHTGHPHASACIYSTIPRPRPKLDA